MADELKRVGLVFKADGAVDFKKSLGEINTAVTENHNAFKLAKASYDENTSAMEKMQDRQKFLASQTQIYSDKVNLLKEELKAMESAENRNEQAIRKKHSQLTQAQVQLTKYGKDLESVTHELESGAVATEEKLGQLADTMKDLTVKAKENESTFSALKSGYDENTSSLSKYKNEQSYLSSQVDVYTNQVKTLEQQLELLEKAEERNERAISEKITELSQATTTLNNYEGELEDVTKKLENGSAATEDFKDGVGRFGEGAKNAGDKLSGVSTAAAGLIGAVTATVPATEEYRKIMGSLEVSSENAGYSVDQTRESFKTLYSVLGDDQTAATTTANLQALGLSQNELKNMINGTIGAWATYGDSIPIDGLAEAINETVKTGEVTGTLADMLNWAGTSEEGFNEKLSLCSSESERANLIMQEMANQGLTQAGSRWQENNKILVDGKNASADLQEATADLAEIVSPMLTALTEGLADVIQKFVEAPPEMQGMIGGLVILFALISPLLMGIGQLAFGIQALIPIFTGLWGIMAEHPIGAIITAIGILIGAFIYAYNNCEEFRDGVNRIWRGIVDFFKGCVDKIKKIFDFEWKLPEIKLPHFNIEGGFSLKPLRVPHFSVDWYAKGGILNRPTVFGLNGNSLMAGGEAGKEAVLPIHLLKDYIREENMANNGVLVGAIKEALAELNLAAENNIYIGDRKVGEILTNMVLKKMAVKSSQINALKGR